jgi:hypothetical protein
VYNQKTNKEWQIQLKCTQVKFTTAQEFPHVRTIVNVLKNKNDVANEIFDINHGKRCML